MKKILIFDVENRPVWMAVQWGEGEGLVMLLSHDKSW